MNSSLEARAIYKNIGSEIAEKSHFGFEALVIFLLVALLIGNVGVAAIFVASGSSSPLSDIECRVRILPTKKMLPKICLEHLG